MKATHKFLIGDIHWFKYIRKRDGYIPETIKAQFTLMAFRGNKQYWYSKNGGIDLQISRHQAIEYINDYQLTGHTKPSPEGE